MNSIKDSEDIQKSIHNMRQALLGIAELEEGVLQNIKEHLDKVLSNIYTQVKEYQHVAAKDAMITETPTTQADEALVFGLENIATGLNEKNQEIVKLQHLLQGLGADASLASGKSVEMLRQHLEELNKRNKMLRHIHGQLLKISQFIGHVPKGVSLSQLKGMAEKLDDDFKIINTTNFELKQQIKLLGKTDEKIQKDIDVNTNEPQRRRPQ